VVVPDKVDAVLVVVPGKVAVVLEKVAVVPEKNAGGLAVVPGKDAAAGLGAVPANDGIVLADGRYFLRLTFLFP